MRNPSATAFSVKSRLASFCQSSLIRIAIDDARRLSEEPGGIREVQYAMYLSSAGAHGTPPSAQRDPGLELRIDQAITTRGDTEVGHI